MNDQSPAEAVTSPHLAHRAAHVVEELGRLDLLGVRAGRVLVCAVAATAAAGDAGQPGLRRAAVRARHAADNPGAADQHGGRFFSRNVVNEIIAPTVRDIVKGARGEVVSVGFVISLWAGSSAISAFVDSITEAHDQTPLRHPVRQRFYALGLYVVMLVGAIATAPFLALGPRKIAEFLPDSWDNVLAYGYYPVAVPRPGRGGEHPLPGVAAQTAAVAPAAHRLGAGDRGVPGRHVRAARLSDLDHQHGLHLRRAGHPDRVPVVRVLPRLRDHDGRRAERRHRGGVAGAGHPREAVPVVAGGEGRVAERRR